MPASRTIFEPEVRLISVELLVLNLVCLNTPSGSEAKLKSDDFFHFTAPAYVLASKNPAIIINHDFNTIEELGQRRGNAKRPKNSVALVATESVALKEMVKGLGISDVWNLLRPTEDGFTFHSWRSSARLDRMYTSDPQIFSNIFTMTLPFGDHLAVVGDINITAPNRDRPKTNYGLWKLNTSILSEEAYELHVRRFIRQIVQLPSRERDIGHWWEHDFKPGLKRETIKYCVTRARYQRATHEFLQECLSEVVNAEVLDWTRFLEMKREFRSWEMHTLRGYEVRARTRELAT